MRGIAFNVSADGEVQLCVGNSNGSIHIFSIAPGPIIRPTVTLPPSKKRGGASPPILALGSAFQSRRGSWAEDMACQLVSADEDGRLCVWTASSAQGYECTLCLDGGDAPCCAVTVRQGLIICGRIDGAVQIFGLVSEFL